MERGRVIPLRTPARRRTVFIGRGARELPLIYDRSEGTLALPPSVIGELGLELGQPIHIMVRDGGHQLVVGPLVGIWVSPGAIRRWSPALRVLVQEARAAGTIPFVFDIDGIGRKTRHIKGWVAKGDQLAPAVLPLPDIIYNRATYRHNLQRRAQARRLRQALREWDGIPFVNTASGFPKWETYEALRFFRETRQLVPATIPFGSLRSFFDFLHDYPVSFLKADDGSGGAQVLRIEPTAQGWRVRGHHWPTLIHRRFARVADMHAFLARLTAGGSWVLQQGITLPTVQGRPWDVRLEVKKDDRGRWQVPFIFVRWGKPGEVVTAEERGGEIFLLENFRARFSGRPELHRLEEKAVWVGLRVAMALESRFGLQGEIGVDFGLDPHGHPQVFEANAKSAHAPVPGQTVPQARWPFRYAVWLAARSWTGRQSGLSLPVRLTTAAGPAQSTGGGGTFRWSDTMR